MDSAAGPLAEQLSYYRAVAGEYGDHAIEVPGQGELLAAVNSFRPQGDVLELACGSGTWTDHLARTASSVTAVDGAPEMLELARRRVTSSNVRFIEADLFSWGPDRRYDVVFFGFWISHVPDERFEAFWATVANAVTPGGCVFFFDDHHRTSAELVGGRESPIVERRLNDGTAFRVIKIPHHPDALEQRLRDLGWDITVTGTPGPFYWGYWRAVNRDLGHEQRWPVQIRQSRASSAERSAGDALGSGVKCSSLSSAPRSVHDRMARRS